MFILNIIAGVICGALSGCGVGGGTLLMVYMICVPHIAADAARGINLIYFLPASAAALIFHRRAGLIDREAVLFTALPGAAAAIFAALIADAIGSDGFRTVFGIFLLITGCIMLFKRDKNGKNK